MRVRDGSIRLERRDDSAQEGVQFVRLKSALRSAGNSSSDGSGSPTALVRVESPRHEAAQALAWVLHCNREAVQARQESGAWATPSAPSSPTAGERQLRAVLICCDDCAVPAEALLGEAAGDVLVIRSHGSTVSEGIATAVALAVKERGARLVGVVGHTECAAAKAGIQKYVDEVAFAWPWKPAARTSMSSTASSEEKCVFDTSEADAKAAARAAEEEAARAKPVGFLERLLSGCAIGAGWDEDESMHGVHGGRLYWDACADERERPRAFGLASVEGTTSGAAHLGDTLAQAVEELSGSRISDAGRRWRDERAAGAAPKPCVPIEAPRARRVYNCSIERSDSQKAAMAAAQREAISTSPGDVALVARSSAKLAAAALLRSLAKALPRALASQLRVCALDCDAAGALGTLRTGWYHNRCYFFE